MLLTLDKFRSPISSLFFGAGETCWLSGELSLQQAWYLVQLQEVEEIDAQRVTCERTVLLFDFRSIEDLLERENKSPLRVKAAHIVTPGYLNGTDSWQMERITRVMSGFQTIDGEEVLLDVLETAEGRKYDCFDSLPFKQDWVGGRLRFDLSVSHNRTTQS
jgi:hypothetical protein